ncbi:MAG TPA: ABC transporter permease [Acidimicrobiales bacterium]
MRTVAVIALHELRRTATDRVVLFFAVALPIVITVIIGSTFGGTESLDVGVLDRDDTARSRELVASLDEADGVAVERYDSPAELRRDVRTGAVAAGVVVPTGYGRDVDRTDGSATVELVSDPTSTAVAAVRATVQGAVADEAVRVGAARFAADHGGGDLRAARAEVDRLAGELPAATVRTVAVESDGGGPDGGGATDLSTFSYTAPANLVLFVFVNTAMVGAVIAEDRKRGIIPRLLATPHGTGTILAGMGAAKLTFALVQSALLTVVGALLFGVDWGDPVAAAVLVVLWAAVASAVGVVVGSFVAAVEQAQALVPPLGVAMGMLGGCMWPLDIVPPAMRAAGHLVPQAWAMDAWIGLVFDGEGLAGVLPQVAVLAAFAVVLGVVAARRLRTVLTS